MLAVSAAVRLHDLEENRPEQIFDEVYYVADAQHMLAGDIGPRAPDSWRPGDTKSWVHPDLGKMVIALGIWIVGNRPLGYRLPSALFGLAILAGVYRLARRVGLDALGGLAALLLAAADPLGIAQSRIATLDIQVALWTLLAVLFMVEYVGGRQRRRWLLLSALANGLAVSTKWSGFLSIAACLLLLSPIPSPGPMRGRAVWSFARKATVLSAVALLVYLAAALPYFSAGHSVSQWLQLQGNMAAFHSGLDAGHPSASWAPTWIVDWRPVWLFVAAEPTGTVTGMAAIGNPWLWWPQVVIVPWLMYRAVRYSQRSLAYMPLVILALYLPWWFVTRPTFLYYMTPIAPFLAVSLAVAMDQLGRHTRSMATRKVLAAAAGATLVSAALFYEVGGYLHNARSGLPIGSMLVATLLYAVAIAALIVLLRRSWTRTRRVALWVYVGIVAGWCITFLPLATGSPLDASRHERLIWLPSWSSDQLNSPSSPAQPRTPGT